MTLLPEFHDQLHAAAWRRAGRRRRLTPPGVAFVDQLKAVGAGVPVLLSTLVVVAVAVIAVVTLSHGHTSSSTANRQAGSSRHALIQTLGVLRRPQTSADAEALRPGALPGFLRIPTAECRGRGPASLCADRLDRSLVRRVRLPGSGYEVDFLPVASTPTSFLPLGGEGLAITLHGPGIYLDASGPKLTDVTALRSHGAVLSANVGDGVNRGVIVVPDGVARVTLRVVRVLNQPRARERATASWPVRDNVALFQLDNVTVPSLRSLHLDPTTLSHFFYQGSGQGCDVTSAIYALPATAHMTWFNAAGTPINERPIDISLYVMSTHHPVPGTTTQNPMCVQTK
jgi:hypothetical protein